MSWLGKVGKVASLGTIDLDAGEDAAKEAGEISSVKIEEAMKALQKATNKANKLGFKAGRKGREILHRRKDKELKPLWGAMHTLNEDFNPFIDSGQDMWADYSFGATNEGLGANLAELSNSGILDSLISEKEQAMSGQLGALGLSRSSGGMKNFTDIAPEQLLGIESMMSDRQYQGGVAGMDAATNYNSLLSNLAQNISSTQGNITDQLIDLKMNPYLSKAGLELQEGTNIANLLSQLGAVQSGSVINQQQSSLSNQLVNLFGDMARGGAKAAGNVIGMNAINKPTSKVS